MAKLRRIYMVGSVATGVVFLDQVTKLIAVEYLHGRGIISFFGDTVRLLLAENHGGFLSLGASLPAGMRSVIFLLLTSVFLAGFTLFTLVDKNRTPAIRASSALIIGGGVGNLLDRMFRQGAVIDFVNVGIGGLRTGIFNVADMAVLFGCIVLLYTLLQSSRRQHHDDH